MTMTELWIQLSELYASLTKKLKSEYRKDFNIENGTDFADHIFHVSGFNSVTFEEMEVI